MVYSQKFQPERTEQFYMVYNVANISLVLPKLGTSPEATRPPLKELRDAGQLPGAPGLCHGVSEEHGPAWQRWLWSLSSDTTVRRKMRQMHKWPRSQETGGGKKHWPRLGQGARTRALRCAGLPQQCFGASPEVWSAHQATTTYA